MKWEKVNNPDTKNIKEQYNLTAYYSSHLLGKIYLCEDGDWCYELDNNWDVLEAETLEEAKEEFLEIFKNHCEGEIDYYKELISLVEELKEEK